MTSPRSNVTRTFLTSTSFPDWCLKENFQNHKWVTTLSDFQMASLWMSLIKNNTVVMATESLGVFPHRYVRKYCFCCPQMLTKFCGHPHAPGMSRDGPFHCRVRFEGPNVIEGLRNLASAGAMSVPLKTHLAKIHTSARSVFMLKNKDRRQRSSQTSTSSQHTPASQLLSQS